MTLKLEIIVFAKELLMPKDGLLGTLRISGVELLGYFATQTRTTADEVFVKTLQVVMIGMSASGTSS